MASGGFCLRVLVLLCTLVLCCCHKCDVYKQTDPEVISRCASLMATLKTSLLADQNNLYILQETFASSMYSPPTVLHVKYTVIYTSGIDLDLDNTDFYWSSSSVYTVVDPIMIFTLETGIFAATYNFEGSDSLIPQISLVLDISNTVIESLNYSKDEFSFAMETLTSRLKAYAHQGELNSEGSNENKGYNWKIHPESAAMYAELSLLFFAFAASIKVAPCFIKRLQNQESVQLFPAIFWALAIVTFFWNLIDLIINVLFLWLIFNAAADSDERYYGYCKLAVLSLVLFFGLVWMLCGCYMAPVLLPPHRGVCPFCCCTCCCTRRGKTRYLYGCAFLQIALFVFLVAANVVPITILIFVHPVIVLSDIALLSTFVFSLVIWITVPLSAQTLKTASGANLPRLKKYKNFVCCLVLLSFFIAVVFYLVILYLKVLVRGAESDDYYKLVFSFFPSAVIGGTGFLIKRKFLDKRKRKTSDDKDPPSDEDHTQLTKVQLEDLENGLANSEVHMLTEGGASRDQDGSGPVNESRADADPQELDIETTTL